jgi:hypothetical protein
MNARNFATVISASRALFGAALLIAPKKVGRSWLGDDIDRPPVQLATRMVGTRDLVLGSGALFALASGQQPARWVRANAMADVLDLVTTIPAFSHLPSPGRYGLAATAAVVAAAGLWAASALESDLASPDADG